MFNALTLTDFKSFAYARLELPAITTVIGANAAGKSNLRDALKFLHAAGRGLTLPEIFGGKSGVGWTGIRGGAPGTLRSGAKSCRLVLEAMVHVESAFPALAYTIEFVANGKGPLVSRESLYADGKMLFDSHPATMTPEQNDPKILQVRLIGGKGKTKGQTISFPAYQPMLSQVAEVASVRTDAQASLLVECVTALRRELGAIRFIDFDPKVMRQPSVPGEKTISESGDNLSSVLRYLVEDEGKEGVLKSWIKALTPMDVAALHFEDYPDGKTLALLEEADGRKTHLSSASDGTVRFLGILASVLSPEAPSLLCFEEIETGLHPVRVHLVTELLQKHAQDGRPQILLTTHSPMLLSWLGQQHAKGANLAYRVAGHPETRLKRFSDIPNLETALAKREAARLLETGWFEEAMFFAEGDPEPLALEMPEEPLREEPR
jgi:predicted ATPase